VIKYLSQSYDALDSHLKSLAKTGTIYSTKHKPPISKDMEILYQKGQLGNNTPESLAQAVWFYTMFYFGRRGRENRREMTVDYLILPQNIKCYGARYLEREYGTKNHAGGFRNNEDNSLSVMSKWPTNSERCPVRCIKTYLAKRNPECESLW